MLKHKLLSIVSTVLCSYAISVPIGRAAADEPSAAKSAAKTSAPVKASDKDIKPSSSSATVDQLIEQLDAADFAKREAACGDLAAQGKEAIPALEKAAVKGDLEVSSRLSAYWANC